MDDTDRKLWAAVDGYVVEKLLASDPPLDWVIEASLEAGLPQINVAPNQGKLLHLLVRLMGARRILEIGTLGGYSTIWMAQALPEDGRLLSLEVAPRHAQVARANIERAGVQERAEVRIGAALETLTKLVEDGEAPFDLVFIDADKENIREYFEGALKLSRPGTLIIVDNVVRNGAVIDASSQDSGVAGVRRFNQLLEALAREKRVTATTIQTVGSKGYDGLTLAVVAGS